MAWGGDDPAAGCEDAGDHGRGHRGEILSRLARLDERVAELHGLLAGGRPARESYTTAEAANLLGKAEFTVREWCRNGRIRADKRACGRGRSRDWAISHAGLTRIRNEGLLPRRK